MSSGSEPLNRDAAWPKTYVRLAELASDARGTPGAGFFSGLSSASEKHKLANETSQYLESILAELDEDAWHVFRERMREEYVHARDRYRGYYKIGSGLLEAKGYTWLREFLTGKGELYDKIRPIPRTNNDRSPDWQAERNGQIIALLEVKSLWESDEWLRYLVKNTALLENGKEPVCRRGNAAIPKGLWDKLKDTVDTAKAQLESHAPGLCIPRIAMLIVALDHEQTGDSKNYGVFSGICG